MNKAVVIIAQGAYKIVSAVSESLTRLLLGVDLLEAKAACVAAEAKFRQIDNKVREHFNKAAQFTAAGNAMYSAAQAERHKLARLLDDRDSANEILRQNEEALAARKEK